MIIVLYSDHSNDEIADFLGLNRKQIENFAYRYNEKVSPRKALKKKVLTCLS